MVGDWTAMTPIFTTASGGFLEPHLHQFMNSQLKLFPERTALAYSTDQDARFEPYIHICNRVCSCRESL